MIVPSPRRDPCRLPATAPLAIVVAALSPTGRAQDETAAVSGSRADGVGASENRDEGGPRIAPAAHPRSRQRQTLLAANDAEYPVLEAEGHNPGAPDVWTESVRLVRLDAATNARGTTDSRREFVVRILR